VNRSIKNGLLRASRADQERDGYIHTLREIFQQPSTLMDTCERTVAHADGLKRCLEDIRCIVFTGSGSSEYAGACVTLPMQQELGITVQTVPSGNLLTHGTRALPALRPALVVSLARSGDSPESVAAVRLLLEADQRIQHLGVTCNAAGRLATCFETEARVRILILDDRTNDRSLVMTSSFSSLVVAARALGLLSAPDRYRGWCRQLSGLFQFVLDHHLDALASAVDRDFDRALFLGSGSNAAAAKEAALKMLEMTAGRVGTLAETYLGLRHGPMSYLNGNTLVVCFLSSEPIARVYEIDLIRELDRKKLSAATVIVGEDIPRDLVREHDVAIECPKLAALGCEGAPLVHVLTGQLLAFFRCLKEGLRPDSPSEGGVISRVVESFPLHIDGGGR
jgi:tagatose-6-phosphate ketose/aldose isomerase